MVPPTDSEMVAELRIERVLYASEDGGYAVLSCRSQDPPSEVTVTGALANLGAGERIKVRGSWHRHPRHGRQLRAYDVEPLDPTDRDGLAKYLTSIAHIGPARADLLLQRYGDQVLERIDADPSVCFSALRGMTGERAEAAVESWSERRAGARIFAMLAPHKLGRFTEQLIRKHAGPAGAARAIRHDPYSLTELRGISFASADALARSVGIAPDSPRRAHAAVHHALHEAEGEGHTHLPEAVLRKRLLQLIGAPPATSSLNAPNVVCLNGRFYRGVTARRERELGRTFAGMVRHKHSLALPEVLPAAAARTLAALSEEQREAVERAFTERISIATGGPGTGKTTIVNSICAVAKAAGVSYALCAPTGRAARRLEEATGCQAETIHKLIEWAPGSGPGRDGERPLDVELLICDESSMLNLHTASALLEAVKWPTHLVLIGDVDQLAPVGCGKPFAELIDSQTVPVTRLTRIFRQAARSGIVQAAHAVNAGETPAEIDGPEGDPDFFFIERSDEKAAADLIIRALTRRAPAAWDLDPIRDCQVLAPIYKGALGINALNERLQDALNPNGKPVGRSGFRIGDKLIATRNAYELGLTNGMICWLKDVDAEDGSLLLDTDAGGRIELPAGRASELRLAYAISVHKAQGCETPMALVVCHSGSTVLLSRNLIYTAISRARRICVMVGEREALRRAVRKPEADVRYSALAEQLRDRLRAPELPLASVA